MGTSKFRHDYRRIEVQRILSHGKGLLGNVESGMTGNPYGDKAERDNLRRIIGDRFDPEAVVIKLLLHLVEKNLKPEGTA